MGGGGEALCSSFAQYAAETHKGRGIFLCIRDYNFILYPRKHIFPVKSDITYTEEMNMRAAFCENYEYIWPSLFCRPALRVE